MVAGASVQARARSSKTTRHPARPSAIVRSVSSASVSVDRPPTSRSALRRNAPPAPGTVAIEPVSSCTRRSMLNPMTYSMCCMRPMSSSRFAILTLPATPPIAGSAKGWASRRTVSGSKTVSPSIMMMRSWPAARIPVFNALGLPELRWRRTRTRGSASDSTRSAVPSVEPSSTTSTSSGWSLARMDRTVASMFLISLYAGTITVTGSVTGGPHRKSGLRLRRACLRAKTSMSSSRIPTRAPTTSSR